MSFARFNIVTDDDLHASLDRFHQKLDRDIQSTAFPSLLAAAIPGGHGQGASLAPSGDAPVPFNARVEQ